MNYINIVIVFGCRVKSIPKPTVFYMIHIWIVCIMGKYVVNGEWHILVLYVECISMW